MGFVDPDPIGLLKLVSVRISSSSTTSADKAGSFSSSLFLNTNFMVNTFVVSSKTCSVIGSLLKEMTVPEETISFCSEKIDVRYTFLSSYL